MEECEHNWAKHCLRDMMLRFHFIHHWSAIDYSAVGWCASNPVGRDGVAEQGFSKDWACSEQKQSVQWVYIFICKTMKALLF